MAGTPKSKKSHFGGVARTIRTRFRTFFDVNALGGGLVFGPLLGTEEPRCGGSKVSGGILSGNYSCSAGCDIEFCVVVALLINPCGACCR